MAKYLKQDSDLGYVEDSAEIEYLKFNNLRHTILGYMWGDFNSEGDYVISPDIQRELIAMKKYVVDTIDNIDICYSNIKFDKQITFMVTQEGNRATLSLVEKISFEANNKLNSGTYSNINEYILDEVETSGVVDKNALYRRWNISVVPGEILDVFHMDEDALAVYAGLTKRFKYLIKANEIFLNNEEKLEEIEAEYSVNLLAIIEHYPKLKKIVDAELKSTLTEKKDFIRIDRPNFAKTVNEIIEKVIENNINVLDEEEKKEFEAEKHNVQVEHNIKVQDTIEYKTETIEVNEEHVGNEITAEKKDKIVLETYREEERQTIPELAQNNLQAEKQVVERNIAEAIAINTGIIPERGNDSNDVEVSKQGNDRKISKDRENANSRLLDAIVAGALIGAAVNGAKEEIKDKTQASSSKRAKLINALNGIGANVKENVGVATTEKIKETKAEAKKTNKEEKKAETDVQANTNPEPEKKKENSANVKKASATKTGAKAPSGQTKKGNKKAASTQSASTAPKKKATTNSNGVSSGNGMIGRRVHPATTTQHKDTNNGLNRPAAVSQTNKGKKQTTIDIGVMNNNKIEDIDKEYKPGRGKIEVIREDNVEIINEENYTSTP